MITSKTKKRKEDSRVEVVVRIRSEIVDILGATVSDVDLSIGTLVVCVGCCEKHCPFNDTWKMKILVRNRRTDLLRDKGIGQLAQIPREITRHPIKERVD